ncbi:unnamed protein product [Larinioides sclopetarius]|uniref:Cytochrome P450 n=1 Tax=Larinioides sclopetarius TaxID=280406 RepID=A0AAV2ATF5_9ARAC
MTNILGPSAETPYSPSMCSNWIDSTTENVQFQQDPFLRHDDYWKKRGVPHMPRTSYYAMWRNFGEKGMAGVVRDMGKNNLGRVYGAFEGSKPHVVISDPELLRDIFIKDFHIFPERRSATIGDPLSDCAVSNLTGEQWKRVRTIITPAFTSKRMRQKHPDIIPHILEISRRIAEAIFMILPITI